MSQENVEGLRRFYEALNGRQIESLRAFAGPEFVYRTREEMPGGGTYDIDEALDRIRALRDMFDELRWEPQEFIDADEQTVVVVVRQLARGRASGVPVAGTIAHVWTIHDLKAMELCVYSDRGQALEAVGLAE